MIFPFVLFFLLLLLFVVVVVWFWFFCFVFVGCFFPPFIHVTVIFANKTVLSQMKKLINKMATPMFSKITMTTRMGAEPCKRKRRTGVRWILGILLGALCTPGSSGPEQIPIYTSQSAQEPLEDFLSGQANTWLHHLNKVDHGSSHVTPIGSLALKAQLKSGVDQVVNEKEEKPQTRGDVGSQSGLGMVWSSVLRTLPSEHSCSPGVLDIRPDTGSMFRQRFGNALITSPEFVWIK